MLSDGWKSYLFEGGEMNNNWSDEFRKHYDYMLNSYGNNPFRPDDFYNLVYDPEFNFLQPLYFSYLNFYITNNKIQFGKNTLDEIVIDWIKLYKQNFNEPSQLYIKTYLLFLLGGYTRNEFILKEIGKIKAHSYKKALPSKMRNYEWDKAIKELPFLPDLKDNKQLKMEYFNLLNGNIGLSIHTIGLEKKILELIQEITNVTKNKILKLFIECYYKTGFTKKTYSSKIIEKRIEKLASEKIIKKINRLIELENILFKN